MEIKNMTKLNKPIIGIVSKPSMEIDFKQCN